MPADLKTVGKANLSVYQFIHVYYLGHEGTNRLIDTTLQNLANLGKFSDFFFFFAVYYKLYESDPLCRIIKEFRFTI